MSNERLEEIESVMTIIESLCNQYEIALIAKKVKTKNYVVIHDNLTKKEYVIVGKGDD